MQQPPRHIAALELCSCRPKVHPPRLPQLGLCLHTAALVKSHLLEHEDVGLENVELLLAGDPAAALEGDHSDMVNSAGPWASAPTLPPLGKGIHQLVQLLTVVTQRSKVLAVGLRCLLVLSSSPIVGPLPGSPAPPAAALLLLSDCPA